jgi:hypothetical protein
MVAEERGVGAPKHRESSYKEVPRASNLLDDAEHERCWEAKEKMYSKLPRVWIPWI